MSPVLESLLERGEMLVLREEAGVREAWEEVHGQLLEAIGVVAGTAGRTRVARDGLGILHEVLPPGEIGALRDEVMPRVRATLFDTTCRVAREVLGIEDSFFVDDYTILRVNYPYEVALKAPMDAENPGIGRVSSAARRDAPAKVVDPVYDPKGYHRDQPPAAWAHGPHLDTWTGHSRDGVNLWWAIGDVVAEHSMFFYPELFGVPLAPDPRSLYLRAGRPLPRPTPAPLAAGELLVFNPEVLHGTHLNVSGLTRVAASTRINANEPAFDPTCFYAREFWHASGDLDAGDLETLVRFPRAEHLAEPPVAPEPGAGRRRRHTSRSPRTPSREPGRTSPPPARCHRRGSSSSPAPTESPAGPCAGQVAASEQSAPAVRIWERAWPTAITTTPISAAPLTRCGST